MVWSRGATKYQECVLHVKIKAYKHLRKIHETRSGNECLKLSLWPGKGKGNSKDTICVTVRTSGAFRNTLPDHFCIKVYVNKMATKLILKQWP